MGTILSTGKIKMQLKRNNVIVWEWIDLAQDRIQCRVLVKR
jgi:hypothetical protein